jgi:hypothetical protein
MNQAKELFADGDQQKGWCEKGQNEDHHGESPIESAGIE